MEWHVDLSEVNGLKQWYKKQPRKMQIASARMLNEFAFGVRKQAIETIKKLMIVRNPRFIANRMRVTKASTGMPIGSQVSWTGSVAGARFSGWTEQEKGTRTDRKRFGTLAGRSGDKHKQLRPIVRLKPGAEVITIESSGYKPLGGSNNVQGFMAMLKRKGENRLVKIGKMLIKRKRSKFELVQVLRRKQPKRVRWLRIARATYFKKTNIDKLWADIVKPLMGRPGKM